MKLIKPFLTLIVSSFLIATTAYAAISVAPIIVNLTTLKGNSTEIAVTNRGDKTAYVAVTPFKIQNPGDKTQKLARITNPKEGLLVFPAKLTLTPHQIQYVKVLLTKPFSKKDQNFMIKFIPKIAGLNINKKSSTGREIGLHLILGYGVRVIARAIHAKPSLIVKKHNYQLTVKNTGNTSIVVSNIYQTINKKEERIKLSCARVYAGKTCTGKLKSDKAPVRLKSYFKGQLFKSITV